jgi:hypothetical protein
MARLHLFEWEDQGWFPSILRNFITDHLEFHGRRVYVPAMQKLAQELEETGHSKVVDLCSGGGGPLPGLQAELSKERGKPVQVVLTDLYPNIDAFKAIQERSKGNITFRADSVSAMNCPADLDGFRTIFTALHHFRPEGAHKILGDAMNKRKPIAAFEASERTLLSLATVLPTMFLGSFLLTPFLGRISLGRLMFTYVIPLAPLFFTWDAFVSCLRTYSTEELKELTRDLAAEDYSWEIGQIVSSMYLMPYRITYVIGRPK